MILWYWRRLREDRRRLREMTRGMMTGLGRRETPGIRRGQPGRMRRPRWY